MPITVQWTPPQGELFRLDRTTTNVLAPIEAQLYGHSGGDAITGFTWEITPEQDAIYCEEAAVGSPSAQLDVKALALTDSIRPLFIDYLANTVPGRVHRWPDLPPPEVSEDIIELMPYMGTEQTFTLNITAHTNFAQEFYATYSLVVVQNWSVDRDALVAEVNLRR